MYFRETENLYKLIATFTFLLNSSFEIGWLSWWSNLLIVPQQIIGKIDETSEIQVKQNYEHVILYTVYLYNRGNLSSLSDE